MKRFLFTFILIGLTGIVMANQSVTFKIQTQSSAAISSTMVSDVQRNISTLLTEINRANSSGSTPDLSGLNMEQGAKEKFLQIWSNMHFSCDDDINIQPCLADAQGYEVRNIPITLKPLDDTYKKQLDRELVISFNKKGVLTGVSMALENNTYYTMLTKGKDVADARKRSEIIKFVEDYYSYYEDKNIEALRNIFSDDALIITGSVVIRKPVGDMMRAEAQIRYSKQNKQGYLENLARTFKNNRYIKIDIDDIKIKRNGGTGKENYYGVTLHQVWHSSNYSDEGYVFLLWDFRDEEHPVIHVRTWQPDHIGDKPLSKDDILNMDDFFIP